MQFPKLVMAEDGSLVTPPPDPSNATVHVWRDRNGCMVATGHAVSGVYWMHWPQLAAYSFRPGDECVTAFPLPGTRIVDVEDIYRRGVLPMVLQAVGLEALHASAVLFPQGVIGFFASSETGKSTFAYGLKHRGYPH